MFYLFGKEVGGGGPEKDLAMLNSGQDMFCGSFNMV